MAFPTCFGGGAVRMTTCKDDLGDKIRRIFFIVASGVFKLDQIELERSAS